MPTEKRGERTTLNRLGRGWKDFDFYILITTVVLMGFSAVTIYSADGGGALIPSNLGVRQALYGSLGLVLMLIVASIDYRILGSLAWVIYGAAMVALMLVLVPGIGVEIAGSRGGSILASRRSNPRNSQRSRHCWRCPHSWRRAVRPCASFGNFVVSMLIVLLPMALVFRQPDLGTSLVYGVIWVAVMALAQTQRRYWLAMAPRRRSRFSSPGSFSWPSTSDGAGPSFSTRRPMLAAMASI